MSAKNLDKHNRWRNKNSSHLLSVDYLYVSKGYQGGVEELTSLFSMGMVVLDASLSDYYQKRSIGELLALIVTDEIEHAP